MGGFSQRERIDEKSTNHAAPISESSSDKLYNSIVRINFTLNGNNIIYGTGFFLKIRLKEKIIKFLITCNHIINESNVIEAIVTKLYYGKVNKEKKLEIKLDRNERYIKCFDKPLDVTLIEIIEKDNIKEDKFLMPDFSYKNGYNIYINENFYLAGYPQNNSNENERSISSGKIIKILDNSEFEHTLDTDHGNSGSPICLGSNLLVVGIHKQGHTTRPINYGTFLGYILDILEKEEKFENKKETKVLNNIIFEDFKGEEKEVKELKNKGVEIKKEDEKKRKLLQKKEKNFKVINEEEDIENLEKKMKEKRIKDKYWNNSKLKNIESLNLIKKIFSHLDQKIKLKISKYNDFFKKAIDINLNNYKFFSFEIFKYLS